MTNFKLYVALHLIGISIPVVLMCFPATSVWGVILLFVYVFIYKPLLDKKRLQGKGVDSHGQSIWSKYPFWSARCRKVLYTK